MKLFGRLAELSDILFRRAAGEITLRAKSTPAAAPTFELPDAAAGTHDLVDADTAATLTGKSIDADNNPISNLGTPEFAAAALTSNLVTSALPTQLVTADEVKGYVDTVAAGQDQASEISYDNATSGLTATQVQAAIDEVEGRLDSTEAATGTNTTDIGTNATNLTNHEAATSTHGVGEILGTTEIQTVSGKTYTLPKFDTADVSIAATTFARGAATQQNITSGVNLNTISGGADGETILLRNSTGSVLDIIENAGADGILTGTGLDLRLAVDATLQMRYDSVASRWYVVGGSGGGGGLTISSKSAAFTAVTGFHYILDSSAGSFSVTLPAGAGQSVVRISDHGDNWGNNPVTLVPATGESIDGGIAGESYVLDVAGVWIQLMWNGTTWVTDDPIDPALVSGGGQETADSSSGSVTVSVGRTRRHPYLSIRTADTYTVEGRMLVDEELIVNGDLVVSGSGELLVEDIDNSTFVDSNPNFVNGLTFGTGGTLEYKQVLRNPDDGSVTGPAVSGLGNAVNIIEGLTLTPGMYIIGYNVVLRSPAAGSVYVHARIRDSADGDIVGGKSGFQSANGNETIPVSTSTALTVQSTTTYKVIGAANAGYGGNPIFTNLTGGFSENHTGVLWAIKISEV